MHAPCSLVFYKNIPYRGLIMQGVVWLLEGLKNKETGEGTAAKEGDTVVRQRRLY
jgi:hypothetical protein